MDREPVAGALLALQRGARGVPFHAWERDRLVECLQAAGDAVQTTTPAAFRRAFHGEFWRRVVENPAHRDRPLGPVFTLLLALFRGPPGDAPAAADPDACDGDRWRACYDRLLRALASLQPADCDAASLAGLVADPTPAPLIARIEGFRHANIAAAVAALSLPHPP
jgi:hypothetical protein